MNLSAGTTLAVAIALTSCNNAAEVKKQVDDQNAKIQTLVDEKLNALQQEVDAECTAKVDSAAKVAFEAWQAEEAAAKKGGKKPAVKPKPVTPKKEEPKKEEPKKGFGGEVGKEKPKGFGGEIEKPKTTGGGGFGGEIQKKQ